MPACPAFDPSSPYATSLFLFVDCEARSLGEEGYRALASGSFFGDSLTGLLAIAVALFGYRMLLGDTPSLRDSTLFAVRIGFLLALTTQWSAYRALAYDVTMNGPAEISAVALTPSRLGGEDEAGLVVRLQQASATLEAIINPPQPSPTPADPSPPPAGPVTSPTTSGAGDAHLERALWLLLVAPLGGLLSVRIAAGLLLAIGPLFVAMLLFDHTRALFGGWVRGLAGASLASVALAGSLALELAVLEPQLAALVQARVRAEAMSSLPSDILNTVALFAIIQLVGLLVVGGTVTAFRMPVPVSRWIGGFAVSSSPGGYFRPGVSVTAARDETTELVATRPRALQVADALMRREAGRATTEPNDRVGASVSKSTRWSDNTQGDVALTSIPLGQAFRRTVGQRQTVSGTRRDAKS